MGIGSTWADRFLRDYVAGWAREPKTKPDERAKRAWWEKLGSEDWLIEPKFEVKLKRGNGHGEQEY